MRRVSEAEPIRPNLAPSLPDDTSLLVEEVRNLLRGGNGECSSSSSCSVNSPLFGYRSSPRYIDVDITSSKFSYTMFKELAQFMELKEQAVDILAVVISVLPINTFTNEFGPGKVQDFVIINEENIPLQLSMFNKFIDIEGQQIAETINNFPVIICRMLKVKFFNGVTLSTRLDSTILVDPPAHEARQLKIWAGQNAVLFAQIIKEKSYTRYNPDLFLQSPQKFTLIFYLQPTQKFAWVKASISFQNIFQRYWYMACKKCYKATGASHGHPYLCNKCSEYQEAVPRCRFDVNLADNTGNVTATLFGELAEKLLTYSALDAVQYFNRNVELPLEHVHEDLKTKLFAVQIQPAQSRYGYLQQRYTVVHFYEENQGEENKSPSTSICINMASNFDETDNLGVTSPLASFETAQISTTKKTKLALC